MKLTEYGAPVSVHTEKSVLVRVAFATVLAAMLLVALHWALNVTNANARQLSTNLTHLQSDFERTTPANSQKRSSSDAGQQKRQTSSGDASGPILEPVDSER